VGWKAKPFYWGILENSYFGGNTRKRDGVKISPRYGPSYRHWIEGCLQHGGALYIGKLDEEARGRTGEVENYLIRTYGRKMNSEVKAPLSLLRIEHEGDVP
jgi:hypothetical protein